MSYAHTHSPPHAPAGRLLGIGLALNFAYVVVEAAFGITAHSLALLSDAAHNLSDVVALALAWLAGRLALRAPSGRYTYGLRGSSILTALANTVLLLLVTGAIASEAIGRLVAPRPTGGVTVMAVAGAGVVINGATALVFAGGRKGELNLRAAFSHMAADALIALGVVVAGGLMLVTGAAWIDPVASLAVSAAIVIGAWRLLREALDLALHAAPADVDPAGVMAYLASLPGVSEVHDLHIWGMSTTETALTAHLVRPGAALDDGLLQDAREHLRTRFCIHHATFQVEAGAQESPCEMARDGAL